MLSNSQNNRNTRSRKAGNGRKRINNNNNNGKLTIYKQPGRFAPDTLKVVLIYQDPTTTRSVISSNAMNWGYRSSAFDPDPAVLSGAIPGFAELANLYSQYCVHSMKLRLQVANQNTEATTIVAWPSNVLQNVNSLTAADLNEYSGNVRAKSRILGSTNGVNVTSLNVNALGSSLVGSRFKTDLDYSSSTSANPTEMYAINIGVFNHFGNFTYAMATKARIFYTIEFFKLRQLES